jgi:hypothetical protein
MADQTFKYSGVTEYASVEAQKAFGISDESPISVTCVYDPTRVPSTGRHVWETNEGQNGFVSLVVGSWNMSPDTDSSGTMGWPLIQFNDGKFAGINYAGTLPGDPESGIPHYQFMAEETEWSITIPGAEPPLIASGSISTRASS